ncbi:LysR substrate-binding domain-containing protein [Amycolatopsis sp. NPDC059027]|uniref:LysR substrate-binding domain-containing protein n=1 Tax=unclassified Amycolatopsis TaxID=2618356 RepID=UPI00367213B4
MLNLERLRVLHAVARTGSVRGAAEALHVTTSAVSQQLSRLEREIGQRLLERQGRGVRLTDAATLLADHAERLLTQVELIEADLAEHRGAVTGAVTIAAFATAARGLLPDALRALRKRYPDLDVRLSEHEPHESLPALARGDLDIAIVQDWPDAPLPVPDGLSRRPLAEDTFDVALSTQDTLADRDVLKPAELRDQRWIGWAAGQICHDWLTSKLRELGAEPRITHTASEHSTQLALVAAGLGAALIPRLGRDPVPRGVRFVPLSPAPRRRIFALWRASAFPRPAIKATLTALDTTAKSGHRSHAPGTARARG